MKSIENKIYEYILKDDVTSVKRCLEDDVMAWSTRDENETTPLMTAAMLNRLAILDVLLTSKCDVNVTDVNGNTALHLAVDEGNCETVKLLVGSEQELSSLGRVIVDAANFKGDPPLMRAAYYDYSEVSRILISQGYDLSVDKMWIINDEKHNLFYQDDTLYSQIRGILRKPSSDGINNKPSAITIATTSASCSCDSNHNSESLMSPHARSSLSPPYCMSPTLKQKIMSPETLHFIPIPFSKLASETGKSSNALSTSPVSSRRNLFKRVKVCAFVEKTGTGVIVSSDSDDVGDEAFKKDLKFNNVPTYLREHNSCPDSTKDKQLPKENGAWSTGARPKFVKSASDGVQSAPCSPLLSLKRQMSSKAGKSGSLQSMTSRKTSPPSRQVVKFCTEIQVYGAM